MALGVSGSSLQALGALGLAQEPHPGSVLPESAHDRPPFRRPCMTLRTPHPGAGVTHEVSEDNPRHLGTDRHAHARWALTAEQRQAAADPLLCGEGSGTALGGCSPRRTGLTGTAAPGHLSAFGRAFRTHFDPQNGGRTQFSPCKRLLSYEEKKNQSGENSNEGHKIQPPI